MTQPVFFDRRSMERIERMVRHHETRRPALGAAGMQTIPPVEIVAFRVVSDLSQEAIDAGTAEHGTTVTCDFASESQPGLTDLRNGCLSPSGGSCNGIVSCFTCDVTVTLVDADEVAGTLGTVWTFEWGGSFSINEVDAANCGWRWATQYVPTSANAAGVRLQLGNALGFVDGCQEFVIRDVNRFGDTDPGGTGETGGSYTIRETPNCTKVIFRGGGNTSVWGGSNRPIYELTWTCTDEQTEAGQALLESMLPECVLGRLDGGASPVGRWTVDLSLFGGSPEPGSILLAKNIGGRWYAMGGRNTRIVGDKEAGSAPFRLSSDGCDLRNVPFEYTNQTYGAEILAGTTHIVTWQHQTRKYLAVRFQECDSEPNQAMNPYRCPCAWDCGDCMPLVYSVDGCPYVYTTTSCRSTDLADWATPTYTAKKRPDWDHGYYASPIGEGHPDCGCVWQLVQYCVDDANGYRGRSWVVEGWCHDPVANTTDHFGPTIVQDWLAKCQGARYDFTMSFGGCCCECAPPDTGCCETDPDEITGTFTSDCAGINGVSLTLTRVSANRWQGTVGTSCGDMFVDIFCSGDMWFSSISIDNGDSTFGTLDNTGDTGNCSPFDVTINYDLQSQINCCPGDGDGTVGTFTL